MALKNYNLQGEARSGQTLIANWKEERDWLDNYRGLKRDGHGKDLTAQPGHENNPTPLSTTHDTYRPPDVRHKKIPPRQANRDRETFRNLTSEIREEELAAEDHSMSFTRGRFLDEPKLHDDLDLSYLTDEPITLHSDKPHNFGRDSHFTLPIDFHYLGHRKVKDD
jgi:hypothetical protein